jgi:hypothetical protein
MIVQQKYLVEFEITVQIEEIPDAEDLDVARQRKLQSILLSDSEATEALLHSELKYVLYEYVEPFSSDTDKDYINEKTAINWAINQLEKGDEDKDFFEEARTGGYLSEVTELIWYRHINAEVNEFKITKLIDM